MPLHPGPIIRNRHNAGDDVTFAFGNGDPSVLIWETADANAHYFLLNLPAGGAVDVPVFAVGGGATTAVNVDLGLFNGITQPTLAIVDGDNDTALMLDFSADDSPRIRTNNSSNLGISSAGGITHIVDGGGFIVGHTAKETGTAVQFEVLGTSGGDSSGLFSRHSEDGSGPALYFGKSRHLNLGSYTILQDNDVVGQIVWRADDGTDISNDVARIQGEVDDASPAVNDIGGALVFFTHAGGGGALTEHVRIAQDGGLFLSNLLAAAASTDVNINGSNELHSVTSSGFYKYDTDSLRFDSSRILDLKPRSFKHGPKKDGAPESWPEAEENDRDDFGLLAEEVADVLPELVNYRDGKPFSVRYSMLSVLLLKEFQAIKGA